MAKTGGDQTIKLGENGTATATLNGKGSIDPDGDKLSYSWELKKPGVTNLEASLSNLNSDIATLDAVGTGTCNVLLTVFDGMEIGTDTATIKVVP